MDGCLNIRRPELYSHFQCPYGNMQPENFGSGSSLGTQLALLVSHNLYHIHFGKPEERTQYIGIKGASSSYKQWSSTEQQYTSCRLLSTSSGVDDNVIIVHLLSSYNHMNTLFLTGNGYCLPRYFSVDGKNNTVYRARNGLLHFPQRF